MTKFLSQVLSKLLLKPPSKSKSLSLFKVLPKILAPALSQLFQPPLFQPMSILHKNNINLLPLVVLMPILMLSDRAAASVLQSNITSGLQNTIAQRFGTRNLRSFAELCTNRSSLSTATRRTVDGLLLQAHTTNCNQAGQVLASTRQITLVGQSISDLSPLITLSNLRELNLTGNDITDLSPLQSLPNLSILRLDNNRITSLSPLRSLTRLSELSLVLNPITDLSPLRPLTGLTNLYLGENQISDITSLAGMTRLGELSLGNNQIRNIAPLRNLSNLVTLKLNDNQITDLSPLRGLTNLVSLDLNNNQIRDISPLRSLTFMQTLLLQNNSIPNPRCPFSPASICRF